MEVERREALARCTYAVRTIYVSIFFLRPIIDMGIKVWDLRQGYQRTGRKVSSQLLRNQEMELGIYGER